MPPHDSTHPLSRSAIDSDGAEHLPRILAAHVKALRRSRGWTRAQLAGRSGLSMRFLARIESGEGNISLVRLCHLAEALGTTVVALLRADEEGSPVVALVGMRGAGKSTVGPVTRGSWRRAACRSTRSSSCTASATTAAWNGRS
jgi:ribosome-binding protein aMBF1 (putative translation factor)